MKNNIITRVNGPVVFVKTDGSPSMREQVFLGDLNLIGEVIEINRDIATVQVYEDTLGLMPGMTARFLGYPMSVELGPGLMGNIYDGIQRPLVELAERGVFIERGIDKPALNREKKWHFVPTAKKGDKVGSLTIIGEIEETKVIKHKVMVPYNKKGTLVSILPEGDYTIEETVAVVDLFDEGLKEEIKFFSRWSIRVPRPFVKRFSPTIPLFSGQRVIDFFFPVAKGGTAAIPGGFGTGKTSTQHQLAKWSDADIIVYIGCGERGNEMTQVLSEFPHLIDPHTGRTLMERTILIANTSNMPVTAREASIYTGITIAEYYRDMGYNIAVMADSTSRWAEALREISGRLEEMPAEEGYPAYLATRLAEFYERAGRVKVSESDDRQGSISVIGAVSPQGGDFSEPVTQHTSRFIKVFWALDKDLASARHFPSINWISSYSEYTDVFVDWWKEKSEISWEELRTFALDILAQDYKLEQVVKLIGQDSLPDKQRLLLEVSRITKEAFLQQDAFNKVDTYCCATKQLLMMQIIKTLYKKGLEVVEKGIPATKIIDLPCIERIMRMKYNVSNENLGGFTEIMDQMDRELSELVKK